MDSDLPSPRKALFKSKQSGILNSKYSQTRNDANGFEKGEFMTNKATLQFEHDVEFYLKALEKELHVQRLEELRLLAEKLKEDAWMYPEHDQTLVLSYENSLLRQSDIYLLTPPNWLNDNIIAFWFEYLEHHVYKDYKDVFGFVCPQTVQYFKFVSMEEVKSTIEELGLNKKRYVFFPVNDCRAQTVPGGTHWSLLVYTASCHAFQHYDSFRSSNNIAVAESLAKILAVFLRDSSKYVPHPIIQEMLCTPQNNTYDCGMHVICNTEGLCRKYIEKDPRPLTEIVPSSVISSSRDHLKHVIYSLRK